MTNGIGQFTLLALTLCTVGYGIVRFPNALTQSDLGGSNIVCTTSNQNSDGSCVEDKGNPSTDINNGAPKSSEAVSRSTNPVFDLQTRNKPLSSEQNPPIPPDYKTDRTALAVGLPIPGTSRTTAASENPASGAARNTARDKKTTSTSGKKTKKAAGSRPSSREELAKGETAGIGPIPTNETAPAVNAQETNFAANAADQEAAGSSASSSADTSKGSSAPSDASDSKKNEEALRQSAPDAAGTHAAETHAAETGDTGGVSEKNSQEKPKDQGGQNASADSSEGGIAPLGDSLPGLTDTPSNPDSSKPDSSASPGNSGQDNSSQDAKGTDAHNIDDKNKEAPASNGSKTEKSDEDVPLPVVVSAGAKDDFEMEPWNNDTDSALRDDLFTPGGSAQSPTGSESPSEGIPPAEGSLPGLDGASAASDAPSGATESESAVKSEAENSSALHAEGIQPLGADSPESGSTPGLTNPDREMANAESPPKGANNYVGRSQNGNLSANNADPSQIIRTLPPPPSPYQPSQPTPISQFGASVKGAIVLPSYQENEEGKLVLNELPQGYEMNTNPEPAQLAADSSSKSSLPNGPDPGATSVAVSKPVDSPVDSPANSPANAPGVNENGSIPESGTVSASEPSVVAANEKTPETNGKKDVPVNTAHSEADLFQPSISSNVDAATIQSAGELPSGTENLLPPVPLVVKSLNGDGTAPPPSNDPPATNDPASTEPPAATTETPAASTEPPAASTEPPAASTEPPAASTEPPATSTEPPATSTDDPASTAPAENKPTADAGVPDSSDAGTAPSEPEQEESPLPDAGKATEMPNDSEIWGSDPFNELDKKNPENESGGASTSNDPRRTANPPQMASDSEQNAPATQWRGQSNPSYSITNRSRKIDVPLQEGSVRIAKKPSFSNENSLASNGFTQAGMGISSWQEAPPVDRLPRTSGTSEPAYRVRDEDYSRINSIAAQFDQAD